MAESSAQNVYIRTQYSEILKKLAELGAPIQNDMFSILNHFVLQSGSSTKQMEWRNSQHKMWILEHNIQNFEKFIGIWSFQTNDIFLAQKHCLLGSCISAKLWSVTTKLSEP